jgi:hypothetical protein
MIKLLITCMALALTGCGDNPFNDREPIQDTDYASIRIEMDRCAHVDKEGSFSASFRWSPKMACLNHLKTRIVHTGKAKEEFYR